jgi:hypothetical protein
MLDPLLTEPQNISGESSAYGREGLEKVFQGQTVGEIIEQRADWDARALKDWRAIENFRIAGDERFRGHAYRRDCSR